MGRIPTPKRMASRTSSRVSFAAPTLKDPEVVPVAMVMDMGSGRV